VSKFSSGRLICRIRLHGPRGFTSRSVSPESLVVEVRRAREADAGPILAIYNDAVATTVATFDTEPRSMESQRTWLGEHERPYVSLVAESAGQVVGWGSLSRWSDRKAYAETAEVSVYVEAAARGRGVGGRLLTELISEGGRSGFHTVLARIADGNRASLAMHQTAGFRPVGVMREVGFKFGRRIDVHLLQLTYPDRGVSGDAQS
jgi:L-amino acid N-acyltransferase YncA